MKFQKAELDVIYQLIRWFRNAFVRCGQCGTYWPKEKMYYYDDAREIGVRDKITGEIEIKRYVCPRCYKYRTELCENLKKIKRND